MSLLIKITPPPQHSIDDVPQWIARGDCWDHDRIKAEVDKLEDRSLHPVERWYAGVTRWSLHPDALLTVPEVLRTDERPAAAVPITEYLLGKPTTFELRVLSAVEWREALEVQGRAHSVAWVELVRRGLVRIDNVDDGTRGSATLEPDRDRAGVITQEWIDAFDVATGRQLIGDLGDAILRLGQGDGAEGKP